jgi:predicted dehydrogenase
VRAEDALTVEHEVTIETHSPGAKVKKQEVSNHLAYLRQVDAFADAVQGKAAFPCSGQDGWQNQEILDAAVRSIHNGRTEEVPRVI